VFNQSSTTFSFGSPDILHMFAHGAVPGKVKTWCYSENDEDFTKGDSLFKFFRFYTNLIKSDATALDLWVLDQLQVLFKNATTDAHLYEQLHSEGVVFFLHLLGLDTTGHSYRPHSKVCASYCFPHVLTFYQEYMNNIAVVDTIVQKVESLFDSFYNGDNDTSYVFTADHGMSVIGNHGDGRQYLLLLPLLSIF